MNTYDQLDNERNSGRVVETNLKPLKDMPENLPWDLTRTAVTGEIWRNTKPGIYDHYDAIDSPRVTAPELPVRQRATVPSAGTSLVRSRSKFKEARLGRRYPETISEWNGFKELVYAHNPEHKVLEHRVCDVSSSATSLFNEKEEEGYMLSVLKMYLMTAGLLGKFSSRGGLGKPDLITLKNDVEVPAPADIALVAEFKSAHNLPLPMTDSAVVAAYNAAYQDVIVDRCGRSLTWSRVCHPIGQLLGYMVENGRRYGVLSSAMRSYFLYIEGDGPGATVRISNPWFVGEPDFLRAWSYVHSMACQQSVPLVASSLKWKMTSSILFEGNEDKKSKSVNCDKTSTNGQGDAATDSSDQMSGLVDTLLDDVEIIGSLGYGRNGVVCLANWHGQKVALNQFDVGKDGYGSFDREIAAYLALQAVWDSLVPTLLFVSASWSGWIKFIGLQLGRDPVPGYDISKRRSKLLSALENEYGFRHDDAEHDNMLFLFDEKTGSKRLVAIDLELYTMIK